MRNALRTLGAAALLVTGAVMAAGTAHADGDSSSFLAAAHGHGSGGLMQGYNILVVPGGDPELISLAKIACAAEASTTGPGGAAAVKAAEPNVTFANKDPMLTTDAPTLLMMRALDSYCPTMVAQLPN
jgi:hypothetical protein